MRSLQEKRACIRIGGAIVCSDRIYAVVCQARKPHECGHYKRSGLESELEARSFVVTAFMRLCARRANRMNAVTTSGSWLWRWRGRILGVLQIVGADAFQGDAG